MIYSWDKFLRPLATTDTNIQIMNNSGIVTQTINPYAVINILIHNNTIRIGMKSGQIVIIPFSNMNESKLALPRIKQMVDSLQKKKPMFINNEIKNFVKSETTDFFYQSNTPTGSGTDLINVGSFWYDTDTGFLYVYISDELSGYNWVTAAGEIGPVGATGSQGYSYQFSGVISSSASLPISATAGISYIDELSGNLWVYNSNFSNWVNGGLVRGSSGTSGTSGSAGTSGTSGLTPTTNWTLSGNLTVDGTSSMNGLTVLQEVVEVINSTPAATASVVIYDFSTGSNWYHSSATTNYTANFINVPTDNNRAITTTIIINQGATPYIPHVLQIDGTPSTIKWSGGTASGTANQVDIVGFTFIRSGNSWAQVLGQINTFD